MAEDFAEVVVIDSQSTGPCRRCEKGIIRGGAFDDPLGDFEAKMNHYLPERNAQLVNVAQHTGRTSEGELFQHVVAVSGFLGSDRSPFLRRAVGRGQRRRLVKKWVWAAPPLAMKA